MKKTIILLLLLMANSVWAVPTVADIANNVTDQIDGLPNIFGAFSYIFGIILGIKGILKLKENNESKGQVKIGIPIAMLVASALFLGLPKFIQAGSSTIFGAGAKTGPAGSKY